jgi:hypothetical protein
VGSVVLWERASRAFVLLWLCVANAAERFSHVVAAQLNLDLVLYQRRAFGDAIGLERSLVKDVEDDAQPVAITSCRSAFPKSQRG